MNYTGIMLPMRKADGMLHDSQVQNGLGRSSVSRSAVCAVLGEGLSAWY